MREYCSLMTSWRRCFERGVGGDGDDVGPRRHHFAHHLVAELDHGLDQLAVLFFDEAFFGAGGDQRFDVLGGRGLSSAAAASSARSISDWKKASTRDDGPREQREHAQQRDQRQQPARRGAAVEQLRQREGHRDHGEPDARAPACQKTRTCHGWPSANQAKNRMPSTDQQRVLDQRERAGALLGLEADPVFQRLLEELERGQIARAQAQAFQVQHLDEGDQRRAAEW